MTLTLLLAVTSSTNAIPIISHQQEPQKNATSIKCQKKKFPGTQIERERERDSTCKRGSIEDLNFIGLSSINTNQPIM